VPLLGGHSGTLERRAAGMSTSIVHHDFTIGGPEINVSGVMKDGREELLMIGGSWHSLL
jgi:leucyl aminopeptidase (aminopeptidase T)